MMNSDLILFIENINSLTFYEMKKKIYELTNNLDVDLLDDLKREVYNFYTYKIHEKIQSQGLRIKNVAQIINDGDETPHLTIEFEPSNTLSKIDIYDKPISLSYDQIMNSHLGDFEFQLFKDIILHSAEFCGILDDLSIRARDRELCKNTEVSTVSEIVEPIDFSNTFITDKIIYLELLGVIDFLKKEFPKASTNKLAKVISAIVGAKNTTVQSYLNPILSKSECLDNTNNPMESDRAKNIANLLINDGFKPKQKE